MKNRRSTKMHVITGAGSPAIKAFKKKTSDGFKKGGAVKAETPALKTGGAVEGKSASPRLDKFARGGRAGGSPFSSGHYQTSRVRSTRANGGYEDSNC